MILENTKQKLKKLILSYLIVLFGQILSFYLAIITIKTDFFHKVSSENFSIFIQKPLNHYFFILLFWYLFTGFFVAILVIPLVKFFRDKIPNFIWFAVFLGQLFLLKDAQIEKLFSFDFFMFIIQFIPAFSSLFIAVYFQSKRYN